jgi:peptidoglycan/LPS O-acetylase OafA/YrhL
MSEIANIAKRNHSRIDAITGLRGLAALLVVYGHSVDGFSLPLVNHFSGEIGVTVFFALSGFLMAYLYLGKDFSAWNVTEYALHRFSRIAPAYLFILLLSFILYATFFPDFVYAISSENILRHILFSGDVSVFWSITPEVEFYFLFVLVWAATSRYLTRFDITGLALLSFGALVFMGYRDLFPGTFIGSKLHYFLFGVIAGIIRSRIGVERSNAKSLNLLHGVLIAAMVAGAVAIATGYGSLVMPFEDNQAFYSSLLTAVFGAFLVFSFSFSSRIGNFFFANRAIVLCGECSFSIYLLHMPVIYFFQKYFRLPLSLFLLLPFMTLVLGLSWLNYRCIERPGARLIKWIGHRLEPKFERKSESAPASAFPVVARGQRLKSELK